MLTLIHNVNRTDRTMERVNVSYLKGRYAQMFDVRWAKQATNTQNIPPASIKLQPDTKAMEAT